MFQSSSQTDDLGHVFPSSKIQFEHAPGWITGDVLSEKAKSLGQDGGGAVYSKEAWLDTRIVAEFWTPAKLQLWKLAQWRFSAAICGAHSNLTNTNWSALLIELNRTCALLENLIEMLTIILAKEEQF